MFSQGTPERHNGCPLPPYQTMNFTSAKSTIFNTLQSFATNSPNYPLPAGADARQIADNRANVTYFSYINQQTLATTSSVKGGIPNLPYPQFKSEGERLMYRQGLAMTAARTALTGKNPALPMGVPLSTNYQIINS